MTIQEFDKLDELEQYEVISKYWAFLAERKDETYTYKLFQLSDFLARVGDPAYVG